MGVASPPSVPGAAKSVVHLGVCGYGPTRHGAGEKTSTIAVEALAVVAATELCIQALASQRPTTPLMVKMPTMCHRCLGAARFLGGTKI